MTHNLEEKLTAYALGELDGADAIEIEALLENDEEARRYVEEIRAIGNIAEEAFSTESLGDERHEAILAHTNITALDSRRRFWSIPSQARLAALAASAVFVAGLAYISAGFIESESGPIMQAKLRVSEDMAIEATKYDGRMRSAQVVGQSAAVTEAELRQFQERAQGESNPHRALATAELEHAESQISALGRSGSLAYASGRGGSRAGRGSIESSQGDSRSRGAQAAANRNAGFMSDGYVIAGKQVESRSPTSSASNLQNVQVGGEIRVRNDFYAGGGGRGRRGGGGADPNSLDLVEQRTRLATRSEPAEKLPYLADIPVISYNFRGRSTNEAEQLEALGYLGNGTQPSKVMVQKLRNAQLGTRFQTSRVDSYIVPPQPQQPGPNTEAYDRIVDNPFKRVIDEPLSTFSIDVDTGSYPNVRRFLRNNQLPPKDAVRIEELLNYFRYDYTPPANDDPFAAHVELVECPWNAEHQLMRIGLKGREVEVHTRPPANLVFLLDVSGSMKPANKLPLVRNAMKLLAKQLRPDDRVAIVTYAGASGLVLPSTLGSEQATILTAIGRLNSGGSTNGAAGIELAYQVARENFFDGGVNRVILATDGDFNVGTTDRGSLDRLIEQKAKTGVFLTVLGVGEGNLKDAMMEQLADKGNGQYAYLDSEREARKVLVDQVGGTLVTIAKDVKIQIDFNPAQVGAYRLIGYENRILAAQDFDDDTKDAGEIGAGHNVTALYEIVPPGVALETASGTQSRYQVAAAPNVDTQSNELLTVKLRHKAPDSDTSELLEIPVTAGIVPITEASRDTRFAASVAAFGMALRESPYRGTTDWDLIANLAEDGLGDDPHGYRAEFMELIQVAWRLKPGISLKHQTAANTSPVLELIKIMPWTGGTYVAEIRTRTARSKRYGVGDQFESFRIISIDPNAQEIVVYSEEHRRNFTLTPPN